MGELHRSPEPIAHQFAQFNGCPVAAAEGLRVGQARLELGVLAALHENRDADPLALILGRQIPGEHGAVHGQRTHTNARTRKGPRRGTVANKKKATGKT